MLLHDQVATFKIAAGSTDDAFFDRFPSQMPRSTMGRLTPPGRPLQINVTRRLLHRAIDGWDRSLGRAGSCGNSPALVAAHFSASFLHSTALFTPVNIFPGNNGTFSFRRQRSPRTFRPCLELDRGWSGIHSLANLFFVW